MLTVGENTYVTAAEADEYLKGEIGAESWASLSPEQKERYLITAARRIDTLMLKGRKAVTSQVMAFPRVYGYLPQPQSLVNIKYAQILEALALSDTQATSRRKLQEQGVKSISVGSASESYGDTAGGGQLLSPAASSLLRPYIAGSVSMV